MSAINSRDRCQYALLKYQPLKLVSHESVPLFSFRHDGFCREFKFIDYFIVICHLLILLQVLNVKLLILTCNPELVLDLKTRR